MKDQLPVFDRRALEAREYWLGQAAVPAPSRIVPDRPRRRDDRFDGAIEFCLSSELVRRLTELTSGGPFLTYVACFSALYLAVSRFSGGGPVRLGTPMRLSASVRDAANALAVGPPTVAPATFKRLLLTLRELLLDAYAHQDYPYSRLREALGQTEDSPPLFDVGIRLDELHGPFLDVGNDICFDLRRMDHSLEGTVRFRRHRHFETSVRRLVRQFEATLTKGLRDLEAPVEFLSAPNPEELHLELVEWNDTTQNPSRDKPVHAEVEARSRAAPQDVAVAGEGVTLRYGELEGAASAIAWSLQRLGVGVEDVVALLGKPGPLMTAAALGVTKAGAAFLPLSLDFPEARLRQLLADSGARCLLGDRETLTSMDLSPVATLSIEQASRAAERAEPVEVFPESLAYVIYTSGSTGHPKAVGVSHGALANLVAWHRATYAIAATDRLTQVAGLAFDASVWETWPALCTGASLHVVPEEARLSPHDLVDWLEEHGATQAFLPTPLAEAVLRLDEPLPSLRTLLTGGDRLRRRPSAASGLRLMNHYGPTEAAVVATCCVVETEPAVAGLPDIGRPVRNTRAFVLDRHLWPLPPGAPGELFLQGVGLARGYLQRPAWTAERFLPCPFVSEAGVRMYATGDLCRRSHDGSIEFLERVDQQVKIGGNRAELGEIEAALLRQPGVEEAVVMAPFDAVGDRRLVAYLVADGKSVLADEELRQALHRDLPPYMVPLAFVWLDELPLTANGKVDRQALPEARLDAGTGRPFVAPASRAEELLAAAWAEVLGLEAVSVEDRFFELAGDSIKAIQVVARARETGFELTPRDLFEHQTIRALARLPRIADGSVRVDVVGEGADRVFATPLQRWLLDQGPPSAEQWSRWVIVEVPATFVPQRLSQALRHLVERHEAIKLHFPHGSRQARIGQGLQLRPPVDLSRLRPDEREATLTALAAGLRATLSVESGPLFDALPILCEGAGGFVILAAHRLILDEPSWDSILHELEARLKEGDGPLETDRPSRFRKWSTALAARAGTAECRGQLAYWRSVAGAPAEGWLASEAEADSGAVPEVSRWVEQLEEDECGELERALGLLRCSPNEILLAALVYALANETGARQLSIDLELDGRRLLAGAECVGAVGPFTVLTPLAFSLPEGCDIETGLRLVKERLRSLPAGGVDYGLLAFTRAQQEGGADLRSLLPSAVGFRSYDRRSHPDSVLREIARSGTIGPTGRDQRRGIEVAASWLPRRLQIEWEYDPTQRREETIARLSGSFLASLRALAVAAREGATTGLSSSDFPAARIGDRDLERVLEQLGLGGGRASR